MDLIILFFWTLILFILARSINQYWYNRYLNKIEKKYKKYPLASKTQIVKQYESIYVYIALPLMFLWFFGIAIIGEILRSLNYV